MVLVVLALKFLTLKKLVSPVKNTSKKFLDFFYQNSLQLFIAEATIFSIKNKINFLPMKT